jgi:hypothetical protein
MRAEGGAIIGDRFTQRANGVRCIAQYCTDDSETPSLAHLCRGVLPSSRYSNGQAVRTDGTKDASRRHAVMAHA